MYLIPSILLMQGNIKRFMCPVDCVIHIEAGCCTINLSSDFGGYYHEKNSCITGW